MGVQYLYHVGNYTKNRSWDMWKYFFGPTITVWEPIDIERAISLESKEEEFEKDEEPISLDKIWHFL